MAAVMLSKRAAHAAAELAEVSANIVACTRCPRLRAYCTALGETKRRAYLDWDYWTLPVPGFGDPNARVLIVGLAPGAHGANRTGRPFTGDGAGNFMYPVLYETGFATQPDATSRDDGLKLRYARIASICRCAPPADKPTPQEIRNCSTHLAAEIHALHRLRVVVALGRLATDGVLAPTPPFECEPSYVERCGAADGSGDGTVVGDGSGVGATMRHRPAAMSSPSSTGSCAPRGMITSLP